MIFFYFNCIRLLNERFSRNIRVHSNFNPTEPKRILSNSKYIEIFGIIYSNGEFVFSFFIQILAISPRDSHYYFFESFFFVVSALKLIQIGKVKNLSLIHLYLFIPTRRSFAIFSFSILISVHFFLHSCCPFLLYFYSLNFFYSTKNKNG